MSEVRREVVDERNHLVATRHGEAAAGAEIVLDVDDQQHVMLTDRDLVSHRRVSFRALQVANAACNARTIRAEDRR
jgi:hypothetical protein